MEIFKQKQEILTLNFMRSDGEDDITIFINSIKKIKREIDKIGFGGIKFNKKEKAIWEGIFKLIEEDETFKNKGYKEIPGEQVQVEDWGC